jgi:hypothetical protein
MKLIITDNDCYLLDDSYKGLLESFHSSLKALSMLPARLRVAVLSDVDQVSENVGDVYRNSGERLHNAADFAVLIGSKDLRRLKTGAVKAGMHPSQLIYVGKDVHRAVEMLKSELGPGIVVLLKGGHPKRLAQVGLALLNHNVRCVAEACNAKVASCGVCPLLDVPCNVFQNLFVRHFVHIDSRAEVNGEMPTPFPTRERQSASSLPAPAITSS